MSTPHIFDGIAMANQLETQLVGAVAQLKATGVTPAIAAILFREDVGSVLYTSLKKAAATRLGIRYLVYEFSLRDHPSLITTLIARLNADSTITGIIVQKPWRRTWEQAQVSSELLSTPANTLTFSDWWLTLVEAIKPGKDVDGLTPTTLAALRSGEWQPDQQVLPATCQAVKIILEIYTNLFLDTDVVEQRKPKVAIVGKSDLLGTPLFWVLKHANCDVVLLGKKELKQGIEQKNFLHGFGVIISATGVANLITGELVDEGVMVVDVGEPRGDVHSASVGQKARFLTPVPGGVGPMTVICLMSNCVKLASWVGNS